ncbi:unnamed protein product [Darwinula stevensoni]|uniref:Uncharacterized protein n=1 Tax=Darwinula stevensoni TaxID=69355 RepID=A0A7R9FQ08_9CRUS|nr:unnamed protein product [Darwinula stevensoni]CAG0898779.1 unnamed protein product [Darwinula stevensoni]
MFRSFLRLSPAARERDRTPPIQCLLLTNTEALDKIFRTIFVLIHISSLASFKSSPYVRKWHHLRSLTPRHWIPPEEYVETIDAASRKTTIFPGCRSIRIRGSEPVNGNHLERNSLKERANQ